MKQEFENLSNELAQTYEGVDEKIALAEIAEAIGAVHNLTLPETYNTQSSSD